MLSEQDSKAGKKQDAFRVLEEMRGDIAYDLYITDTAKESLDEILFYFIL